MELEQSEEKGARRPRTLKEEIALQREKLRKLEERQREQDRKDRERNIKAVHDLLRTERLDLVASAAWRAALPEIRRALEAQGSVSEAAAETEAPIANTDYSASNGNWTPNPQDFGPGM
jgi:hypothetical protein